MPPRGGGGGQEKGKGLLDGTLDIGVGIACVSITLTPVFVSYHCNLNWESKTCTRRERNLLHLCSCKAHILFQPFRVSCVKRSKECRSSMSIIRVRLVDR